MDLPLTCPSCKGNISPIDYFCPLCGKKLKEKPLSTTLSKQLWIYFISFFLPPLGVWPAIKYLRQADEKSKKIGLVALVLTIISIAISTWLTLNFVKSFQKGLDSQINLLQGIDY